MKIKFSLFLILMNLALVGANELSPTFLPMIKGEWRISSDHSSIGQKTYQACLADEELQKIYGYEELWLIFKENSSECQLQKGNTRSAAEYRLTCKEPGMTMKVVYRLIKNGYSRYTLEKSLETVPEMPAVGFKETIIFERLGKCSADSKK